MTQAQTSTLITAGVQILLIVVPILIAYWKTVAPPQQQQHILDLTSQAVRAAQQFIPDPQARYAYADATLARLVPGLQPEDRKRLIEDAVATAKLTYANFSNLPPAPDPVPEPPATPVVPPMPPIDPAKVIAEATPAILEALGQALHPAEGTLTAPAPLTTVSTSPTITLEAQGAPSDQAHVA